MERETRASALWSDNHWGMPVDAQPYNHSSRAQKRRQGLSPCASLIARRLLGLAIALSIAYGIFHVVSRSDVFAPVLANVEPVRNLICWAIEDPMQAWMALAVMVISHIGVYYILFEDRK